jgi:hypothetical protein
MTYLQAPQSLRLEGILLRPPSSHTLVPQSQGLDLRRAVHSDRKREELLCQVFVYY